MAIAHVVDGTTWRIIQYLSEDVMNFVHDIIINYVDTTKTCFEPYQMSNPYTLCLYGPSNESYK
jgi:hypothetical protein